VEAALQLAEATNGDVTAISVGGESVKEALKTALAMGCKDAILVNDPALVGADSKAVACVLANAIRKVGGVQAAFFGKQAIDGDMGVTGAQSARYLGWPIISLASSIQTQGEGLRIERTMEEGKQIVETPLPAVITVSKDIGEPRYPSFMGIRKASRASIPVWTVSDLGIQAPQSVVRWPEVMNPPAREVKTEMITGSSPQEIAEKLADKILEEKVL
jgi:electron transfer flavoprotein beta subunit